MTVKTAKNSMLNTRIVVNKSGWTLYHLTTENGTSLLYRPMRDDLAAAYRPQGNQACRWAWVTERKLGTIKRPDGRIQVTYAGMTLYRYSADSKAGQSNGEGIQNIFTR